MSLPPKYITYDKWIAPNAFGFTNTGAICWWNALLQTMLGLSSVTQVLFDHEHELTKNVFAMAYLKLLHDIDDLEVAAGGNHVNFNGLMSSSATILAAFMDQLRVRGIKANLHGQQCADEGFTLFIDMLDCPQVENLFKSEYEISICCVKCEHVTIRPRDQTFRIPMPSDRDIVTTVKDKKTFERWLFTHVAKHEDFKCEKCGNVVKYTHRVEKLKRLSEVVVVMFNQFDHKTVMYFPQEMHFNSNTGTPLKFQLVGKINHSGTRHSGHYWADTYRCDSWMMANDSQVSDLSENYPDESAFMVFYHMLSNEEQ